MNLDISQIISQIIAFLIMLWVLKRFGWKPLMDVLQERQHKIQTEFKSIATQEAQLKNLMTTYEDKLRSVEAEARQAISRATAEGRQIANDIQEEAKAKTREMVALASDEIKRDMSEALIHMKKDVVHMVIQVSEKFMREKLDADKQKQLIENLLEDNR